MQHVDPTIGWDDEEYTLPPRDVGILGRVFVGVYLGVCVMACGAWVWATSVPGLDFLPAMASIAVLLLVGATWFVCAAVTAWRVASGRLERPGRYLVVVPALGCALVAATVFDLPLRARFEPARRDFDLYAAKVLTAADGVDLPRTEVDAGGRDLLYPEVPDTLGGFELRSARVVPEGLLIFDAHGAGFDDAGFAYLPDGRFPPGDGSFESPDFTSLGGGWYAFTASW